MPVKRTTISFTPEGMDLIREAAKRQGSGVSQFVREAAPIRATKAVTTSSATAIPHLTRG